MDGSLFRGLIFLQLLLPGLAMADAANSEWYSTTHALSMGNVGIASSDDPTTSAFYNPAALARIKKTTVEVFNPQVDIGGGVFSLSSSTTDWAKHLSFSKAKAMLKRNPGVASSVGFGVFPNVSAQNFSFGVLLSGSGTSYYDGNKDAYFYHSRKLLVPSLGISAAGLGNRVRIGAAVRGVQIAETNVTAPDSTASPTTAADFSRNGFGVGLDAGMLLTLPWGGLPTIGAVVRNVGDTAFPSTPILPLGGPSANRHEKIKMSYDGGFSLTPKVGKNNTLTFAVDYRDILNSTQIDDTRRLNAGVEYTAAKMLSFRAGFSQGYWTAGFGFNAKSGSLDIGSYGEELSPRGYHGFCDRRYSIRITRRF